MNITMEKLFSFIRDAAKEYPVGLFFGGVGLGVFMGLIISAGIFSGADAAFRIFEQSGILLFFALCFVGVASVFKAILEGSKHKSKSE
jgi:hypothetical protein